MSLVESDKINCSAVIPKRALLIKISYKKLLNKILGVLFKVKVRFFLKLNLSFRKIIIDILLFNFYKNFSTDFFTGFSTELPRKYLKDFKINLFSVKIHTQENVACL